MAEGPQAMALLQNHLTGLFLDVNLEYPGIRVLNIDPPVIVVDKFLSENECKAYIEAAIATKELKQSMVGGYVGSDKTIRTSSTLAINSEVVSKHEAVRQNLDLLLGRAVKLLPVGLPATSAAGFNKPTSPGQITLELPQIAHYLNGQHFSTHEDAFPVNVALSKGYQRRATLLVYLNDVAQGGATYFDHLGFGVQPARGKALLFFPSFKNGAPDPRTLHTAQDAVDEKWVSQLWVSSGLKRPPPPAPPPPSRKQGKSKSRR